uniref:Uncharacterized protein n=1 Tax=Oryza brachyantha TaxID=4533 RepID=J3LMT3_ORYBR
MTAVMSVKEATMTSTSVPNGRASNVHPSLGRPRLLSSNMLLGASGSRDPDRFFFAPSRKKHQERRGEGRNREAKTDKGRSRRVEAYFGSSNLGGRGAEDGGSHLPLVCLATATRRFDAEDNGDRLREAIRESGRGDDCLDPDGSWTGPNVCISGLHKFKPAGGAGSQRMYHHTHSPLV